MRQYVVQKGDTLRRVVARYSLAYEQLITANPWAAQRPYLQQGQMLYLPASRAEGMSSRNMIPLIVLPIRSGFGRKPWKN